jgi:ribosomal-protein-serine acetyltransferase
MFAHRIDDHLELRILEDHHADELYALVINNRAHARQWLPWVDDTKSVDDTKAFIRRSLERFAKQDGFQCGIFEDGKLVGGIGHLYVNWSAKKTEVGYWLAEQAQGRGIMTRAVIAMMNHAFDVYGMNRFEIHCATGNQRSRAIPERLGFKDEGTLREAGWLYDHFVDHVVYSILAREWKKLRTSQGR